MCSWIRKWQWSNSFSYSRTTFLSSFVLTMFNNIRFNFFLSRTKMRLVMSNYFRMRINFQRSIKYFFCFKKSKISSSLQSHWKNKIVIRTRSFDESFVLIRLIVTFQDCKRRFIVRITTSIWYMSRRYLTIYATTCFFWWSFKTSFLWKSKSIIWQNMISLKNC
jgi:hypothetical protein